jgi:hypothetical protein
MRTRATIVRSVRTSLVTAIAIGCLPACHRRGHDPIGDVADAASADVVQAHDPLGSPAPLDASEESATPPIAPCSGPGYGPGPELHAPTGQPSFVVLFDCLWPSHARMEISVSLRRRSKRAQVEGLLHSLWKGLEGSMGTGFPETVKLCVFAPGASVSDTPLGCLRKGYEPEGEPGEEEADLRIDMPPEPEELAEWLGNAFSKGFTGTHRPRVTFNTPRRELAMVYPYLEGGTDRWAATPAYVDMALPFFAVAWQFYPPKTELSALDYQGVWKTKTLLRVRVADLQTFLAMDPWGVRQRLSEARISLQLDGQRTPEQSALVRRELEAALAKLPKGSVTLDPSLP